jgi:DNA-binding transcriptional MerR regulator
MRIGDLTARTGVVERQIRYLIAEGIVPPPRGGRATAEYGEDHVAAIERYNHLHEAGFPPAAIKLLLQAKEGAPFPVAPGITLVVAPDMLASGLPVEPLVGKLRKILTALLKEPGHGRTRKHG